jgi:quercetin dioxygenase-like cupin family protein
MKALKDAGDLLDVDRLSYHAERADFRITELQISSSQKVPWHYHNEVEDTFYVLRGELRIFLRDPKEEVRLAPGGTYSVAPRRAHLVTNGGNDSAVFFVLQRGSYDIVPLT